MRTHKGFSLLVEKEWVLAGHRFCTRSGLDRNFPEDQKSPVFLQFLDCVQQIWQQYPLAFEFNLNYLAEIGNSYSSGKFGNFLCENEQVNKLIFKHLN